MSEIIEIDIFEDDSKFRRHVVEQLDRIFKGQQAIERSLKKIMSKQDDLDALVQHENDDLAAIGTAITTITEEVANLVAANPTVDFSGLTSAVAQLDAVPGAILAAVPPATPPAAA